MIRCVLSDIEGTIVAVSFVREVLFPYAQRRLGSFLRENRENPVVRQWAAHCQDTVAKEWGTRPGYDELPGILNHWIEGDRKHPGLKAIQGMIWEEGYRSGAFTPELYSDVAPALRRWRRGGLRLALYSSGSEQAQRLLIAHTNYGDLTDLFEHYFDTGVGAKLDPSSYRRIAATLGLAADGMVFLSDAEPELDAAAKAGVKTVQVVRPGTISGSRHLGCSNFESLDLHNLDNFQSPLGRSR